MSHESRLATVVGGGLAGSEAAWALANRGFKVALHEMRPVVKTPAHQTDRLAELVCSNSFKSVETGNAHGLLKAELRLLGSLLLECADEARVPGGAALVVDRDVFSKLAHARIEAHPNITVLRGEVTDAARARHRGDRSADIRALGRAISERLGRGCARVLRRDRADRERRFARIACALRALALRQGGEGRREETDYLNAPLSRDAVRGVHRRAGRGRPVHGHEFDAVPYFEGCLPVEEMARRGRETLRFGPMKPVGLPDPRTGREPWAVVQLRREDKAGRCGTWSASRPGCGFRSSSGSSG